MSKSNYLQVNQANNVHLNLTVDSLIQLGSNVRGTYEALNPKTKVDDYQY